MKIVFESNEESNFAPNITVTISAEELAKLVEHERYAQVDLISVEGKVEYSCQYLIEVK